MAAHKILLGEDKLPRRWYNVLADMPTKPAPYLHPGTQQPVGPDDLKAIFPMALIEQEVSSTRWIDIPEEVLDVLSLWRPTPLHRALMLEKALGTPARIYYKNESVSPAGSHKPNTSVPQAYYNAKEGKKRLATETGAGQWGSALAFATSLYGLQCMIYMVKVSYQQKPYRRSMMHTWGAEVIPSPSNKTNAGRAILEKFPDSPGSLGIAISEAVEDAATREDTNYALGSVLNHVILHQTRHRSWRPRNSSSPSAKSRTSLSPAPAAAPIRRFRRPVHAGKARAIRRCASSRPSRRAARR